MHTVCLLDEALGILSREWEVAPGISSSRTDEVEQIVRSTDDTKGGCIRTSSCLPSARRGYSGLHGSHFRAGGKTKIPAK